MEDLVFALRLDCSQQREIVLHMLDHIQHQDKIEMGIFLVRNVSQLEVESFVGPTLRKVEGLRRNVISPKNAFAI